MTSENIFVSFEAEGRFYYGTLSPVSGMAAQKNDRFHLTVNHLHYGVLRRLEIGWKFDSAFGWDLAGQLGKQVEAWEKERG